jgi:hypothetical protein
MASAFRGRSVTRRAEAKRRSRVSARLDTPVGKSPQEGAAESVKEGVVPGLFLQCPEYREGFVLRREISPERTRFGLLAGWLNRGGLGYRSDRRLGRGAHLEAALPGAPPGAAWQARIGRGPTWRAARPTMAPIGYQRRVDQVRVGAPWRPAATRGDPPQSSPAPELD